MIARRSLTSRGVAATERATVTMGPLTLVVSEAEFDAWYASAAVGDVCKYASGPAISHKNAVCKKVYDLAQSGYLHPWSSPGAHFKDYHVRLLKRSDVAAETSKGANNLHREAAIAGTEAGRVLDLLKRAANFHRQVPSLEEIAQRAGLKNRQRANYLKSVLEEKGLIEIKRKQGCVQVIRIVSSGKCTRGGV